MKIKLTQKQFFIAGLCLIAFVVIGANPSFTDFIASQFDTSGNVVKIKSGVVLTNVSEWGPMTASDTITASNGFFSLGTAAGELVLGPGSGTGGIFDYSGATKSNQVVITDGAGRFISTNDISGLVPSSPQIWSNFLGFIFPAGEPAPSGVTNPGPSISIYKNGSVFIGTNVFQDQGASLANVEIGAVSMLESNEAPNIFFNLNAISDENYTYFSTFNLTVLGDPTHPEQFLAMDVKGTNASNYERTLTLGVDTSGTTTPFIKAVTNAVVAFQVDQDGLTTASGFTDNSGTPGSLVAYQGGNRLGPTNITAVVENNFFTNISVTNLTVYDSVVVNTNVTIKGNVTVNNITVTNGITNLNLTANSLVETDPNKALKSLANGGANTFLQGTTPPTYTNDVRGAISALPNASLANSSVTVNGTANHITTTSASIALGGAATLDVGTSVDLIDTAQTISATKAFTASNYIAGAQGIYTNANNTTPDFNVLSSTLSTNNNFKWLLPTHLDTSGKVEQWIITHVTNSLGTLINMTAPDNVHVCGGGANNVTNWTEVRWQYIPPSGPTNYWPSPGY